MIKYLITGVIFVYFCSCSIKQVEYLKFIKNDFSQFSNLELKIIDYRLANAKKYKKGYANTYLCRDFSSNKIVKVVSTCTNIKFDKDTFVVLYKCESISSDTIIVVSDKKWEQNYKSVPLYFGAVAIPT